MDHWNINSSWPHRKSEKQFSFKKHCYGQKNILVRNWTYWLSADSDLALSQQVAAFFQFEAINAVHFWISNLLGIISICYFNQQACQLNTMLMPILRLPLKSTAGWEGRYSLRPKLSTKSCFIKQKCQIQMGVVNYKNVATPLSTLGINTTRQHFQMRYMTLF